jgi:hypothetical protein
LVRDENGSAKLDNVFKAFKNWWRDANGNNRSPNRKDMKACLEKKLGRYLTSAKGGWRGWRIVETEHADQPNDPSNLAGDEVNIPSSETILATGSIEQVNTTKVVRSKPTIGAVVGTRAGAVRDSPGASTSASATVSKETIGMEEDKEENTTETEGTDIEEYNGVKESSSEEDEDKLDNMS